MIMNLINFSKNFIKNTLVFLISLAISVAALDLLIRVMFDDFSGQADRVLFYTSPSFVVGAEGGVRYQPNSKIRMVALYGSKIDYDVTHVANNFGLLDSRDYKNPDGVKNVAFVGDSFTASSGGSFQWVAALNNKMKADSYDFYNLGVAGTGFEHFEKLLGAVSKRVYFSEVNIVVISHDFFRSYWYPKVTDEGVRLCFFGVTSNVCRDNNNVVMHRITQEQNHEQILDKASEIYLAKNGDKPWYSESPVLELSCRFAQRYLFGDGLESGLCKDFRSLSLRKDEENERFYDSMQVLDAMAVEHPRAKLRLVHIPEKAEVSENRYSIDIQNHLKEKSIEYVPLLDLCNWDVSMFHEYDAHPNDKGYQNLVDCISKSIYKKQS